MGPGTSVHGRWFAAGLNDVPHLQRRVSGRPGIHRCSLTGHRRVIAQDQDLASIYDTYLRGNGHGSRAWDTTSGRNGACGETVRSVEADRVG
jgi:hypothetical protein